jgi:hypothetical protein
MPNVHAKVPAASVGSHSAGFSAALDAALLKASELRAGGGVFDAAVNVELWAEIKVTNPGQIQQYCVTLSERP